MNPPALSWLRRSWYVVAVGMAVMVLVVWAVRGILDASHDRIVTRAAILQSANDAKDLALQVRDQNMRIEDQNALILQIATAVDNATSKEAQERSSAVLAGAIADIRRSTDCVAFYFAGERPAVCTDVTARLDSIRRGLDPFTRPTPGGTP